MGDGHFLVLVLRLSLPDEQAVEGCQQIVDLKSEVGVETGFVIGKNVDSRHDDADYPQGDAGSVFEPQIPQANDCTEDIKH